MQESRPLIHNREDRRICAADVLLNSGRMEFCHSYLNQVISVLDNWHIFICSLLLSHDNIQLLEESVEKIQTEPQILNHYRYSLLHFLAILRLHHLLR